MEGWESENLLSSDPSSRTNSSTWTDPSISRIDFPQREEWHSTDFLFSEPSSITGSDTLRGDTCMLTDQSSWHPDSLVAETWESMDTLFTEQFSLLQPENITSEANVLQGLQGIMKSDVTLERDGKSEVDDAKEKRTSE
jgi:hypothetical protein